MDIRINPTEKQRKAWQYLTDKKTEYVFFGGGAGSGKSWFGCEWLLILALLYPGAKLFMARNELKRLLVSTFLTFRKVCAHHKIDPNILKYNGQLNYIEFVNFKTGKFDGTGSRIDLLDVAFKPSDPLFERFGSTEYNSGFCEEVGEWHEKAFDVLKSRTNRHKLQNITPKGKMLLTCNPKKNWVYFLAYKPWEKQTQQKECEFLMEVGDENTKKQIPCAFIKSLYYDNPHTAKEYESNLRSIRDKSMRERLLKGNWEYSDTPGILIEYDNILDMFKKGYEPERFGSEMYITVDAARFGRDKATIFLWQGLFIRNIYYYDVSSMSFLKEKIMVLAQKHKIPNHHICIDDDGVGGGLVDFIDDSIGFVNGSRAVEEENEDKQETDRYRYVNLRSQCYFLLSDYINKGKIGISDKVSPEIQTWLIEELSVIAKDEVEDNEKKLRVLKKEDLKNLLSRSPDFSDAMMMRMYFELYLLANREIVLV